MEDFEKVPKESVHLVALCFLILENFQQFVQTVEVK